MEAVLAKANDLDTPVDKFDTAIADLTGDDPLYAAEVYDEPGSGDALSVQPQAVAQRLSRVLTLALPEYTKSTHILVRIVRSMVIFQVKVTQVVLLHVLSCISYTFVDSR